MHLKKITFKGSFAEVSWTALPLVLHFARSKLEKSSAFMMMVMILFGKRFWFGDGYGGDDAMMMIMKRVAEKKACQLDPNWLCSHLIKLNQATKASLSARNLSKPDKLSEGGAASTKYFAQRQRQIQKYWYNDKHKDNDNDKLSIMCISQFACF